MVCPIAATPCSVRGTGIGARVAHANPPELAPSGAPASGLGLASGPGFASGAAPSPASAVELDWVRAVQPRQAKAAHAEAARSLRIMLEASARSEARHLRRCRHHG